MCDLHVGKFFVGCVFPYYFSNVVVRVVVVRESRCCFIVMLCLDLDRMTYTCVMCSSPYESVLKYH